MCNNVSTFVPRGKCTPIFVVLSLILGLVATVAHSDAASEPVRFAPLPWGIDTPAGRCVVCHSLESGGPFRVAPNLWAIIGAEKARAKNWYVYSAALLKKGGVWTEKELDQFLADANDYLPGTTKSILVKNADERREIIDFLKTLTD